MVCRRSRHRLTLIVGALIGAASGALVVFARIDSFIATLAMSSVLLAANGWLSDNQQILNLPLGFQELGTGMLVGVTYPVWIMLGLAIVIWYVLERTPVGRRIYAVGGNTDAARLAGVSTGRVVIGCLAAVAVMAAIAGILTSSRSGVGDPTTGPSFLLPAFAAAFLGSTQFKPGPVQRRRHHPGRLRPRGRGQGPAASRRPAVDSRPVQRPRSDARGWSRHVPGSPGTTAASATHPEPVSLT